VEYLLDTNVFIQAKEHYAFEFCPAFWDWIAQNNARNKVYSIEHVKRELLRHGDSLATWAKNQNSRFFLPIDSSTSANLSTVSNWVAHQSFSSAGQHRFLQGADYYLIAYALTQHRTVVTHESENTSRTEIKIPIVCRGLSIRYMNPFNMLRNERARFVLETSS